MTLLAHSARSRAPSATLDTSPSQPSARSVRLHGYLERIGYDGPVEPTLACLRAVHRRQAVSIPYENLDVQLGVNVGQDPEALYDKLVRRRRGGWCYELNGLLQQALQESASTSVAWRAASTATPRATPRSATTSCCWSTSTARTSPTSVSATVSASPCRSPRASTSRGRSRSAWSASTTATGASGTTPAATPRRSTSAIIRPTRTSSRGSATACRRRPSRGSSSTWPVSRCRSTGW